MYFFSAKSLPNSYPAWITKERILLFKQPLSHLSPTIQDFQSPNIRLNMDFLLQYHIKRISWRIICENFTELLDYFLIQNDTEDNELW